MGITKNAWCIVQSKEMFQLKLRQDYEVQQVKLNNKV